MKRVRLWPLAVMVGVGMTLGCTGVPRVNPAPERVIESATPDEVIDAATVILQREFGRIAERTPRRLVTAYAEYTTARESGTARDLYGAPSQMRRQAMFEVGQRGVNTVASLRVVVEREDTARQRVTYPRQTQLSDYPAEQTPITVDAATTEEQNTVWTRVREDARLARALLEELQDVFARATAEVEVVEPGAEAPPEPQP